MVKKKTSKITIDGLANMVAGGFERVTNDINELKSDVGGLKSDVGELKSKVSKIDYRLDEVYDIVARLEEGDILDLQKRVGALEKSAKTHVKQLG